jgi:hypothetical protein
MRPTSLLALCSVAALLTPARGSTFAPLPPEIVTLPEFKVQAERPLPPPEKWTYARVGNIEFLSNASDGTTRRFVTDFRDFQNALAVISPQFQLHAELPVSVILCARRNAFDVFVSDKATRGRRQYATALLSDPEIAALAIDLQRQSIDWPESRSWFNQVFSDVGEDLIDHREEMYREYINLVLTRLYPSMPLWLSEGLSQIYGSIDITSTWIDFGSKGVFLEPSYMTVPVSYGGGFRDASMWATDPMLSNYGRNNYGYGYDSFGDNARWDMDPFGYNHDPFNNGQRMTTRVIPPPIISFARFFAYSDPNTRNSRETKDIDQLNWSRQAATFVHMCLYGENGQYRAGFMKFVERQTAGPTDERTFRDCFGMSYKDMGIALRGYTQGAMATHVTYKAKPGVSFTMKSKPALRPATDAEIGRIKGEAYRLAGLDELARTEFVQAYLRGERDPQLLASLGLMARQRGDQDRARTYLEVVAREATPVPRPRAYLELARLRGEDIRRTQSDAPFTAEQVQRQLEPLFTARKLSPALADVYREIARVWEQSRVAPQRANLAVLDEGVKLFPFDADLTYRSAALLAKNGFRAEAAVRLDQGLKVVRDPQLRAKFEQLKQQLDPTPAPSAVVTPAPGL